MAPGALAPPRAGAWLACRAPLAAPRAPQRRIAATHGVWACGSNGSGSAALAAALPLAARSGWPLRRRVACDRPCTAHASSSSGNSGGATPEQQPCSSSGGSPPPLPRSGLPTAVGAAWLCVSAVVLLAARPAAAAVPPGGGPEPYAAAATAAAAADTPSTSYHAAAAAQQQQRGWSDTGILLAAKPATIKAQEGKVTYATPQEIAEQGNSAVRQILEQHTNGKALRAFDRATKPSKGGRKVKDPTSSLVEDISQIPSAKEFEKAGNYGIVTAWRPEKLREMTYTQFWNLVRERKVDSVRFADDRRSVRIVTKASAPGGARTEKVGLPFDPDLFDHLVEHGVFIEDANVNPALPMLHALARLVFPIAFSFLLIKFAFRLGRKQKRDKIFGGAKLEMIKPKDASVTFKDIAGIDQVKAEIMEIVAFLRNPAKFLSLGARSPAGVLLVGPPGTGKTLLAKAIAGEAGVPFFSIAGTEFMEMFVGVGASRVRDMFQQARKNAPCILFIDEFDGIGKARSYGGGGNDESVHTINQLLTEMDGFEDNTGIVVIAATNRPSALDQALTRPGRFDRIVHLPLPNVEGRVGILKVHARDKKVDPNLDFPKIARATAGFTGAELMNLMNQSAIVAVRQQQACISESEVFEALEKIHRDKLGRGGSAATNYESDIVPPTMRKTIAIYEAARALVGYITPHFDEIQRVSVCPGGVATGYTYFLPLEETLESRIITKGYMEAKMVVAMAGRCAERLVLGEANVSTAGAADLEGANHIAREMVFRCGFSKRLGPVSLMDNEETYLGNQGRTIADLSTELAMIAYEEVEELVEAAEAKAYYGLATNYAALAALANTLMERESLTGDELRGLLEQHGVKKFAGPEVEGFGWTVDGGLDWPGKPAASTKEVSEQLEAYLEKQRSRELATVGGANGAAGNGGGPGAPPAWWAPNSPYEVRTDIADLLDESK
ncbi:ATP-dependent zinc metalloprotease chloroplastic [Micractinium conductrix]|uniref:ATP-dependent zinc metalloprotease chloroplastic n=1 Tax=Micractinium conductrix TaxID=554055 RepID=A0A2P6VJU0_9CHLO|nr:ATP-dependent zinc metalloprotease chloroplastic [Micractinium conductrix]|eukprot:PSC74371.1 ATP-dependent zinc metalloprotease chloroplastic [Micractinium conductrix]